MAARITSVEDEQDIVMSCESSSYDEDETYGDEEGDTPTDSEIDPDMRGAQPYLFVPSGDESDEGHEDSDEDDRNPRRYRLNNSNW